MSLTITKILRLLVLAFSLAGAISIATCYWLLDRISTNTRQVDAVAELRSRANRVHWVLNRAHLERADIDYLRRAQPAIQEAITALQHGGSAFGRTVPRLSEDYSGHLNVVKQRWASLSPGLIALLGEFSPPDMAPDTRLHPQITDFESQGMSLLRLLENARESMSQRMWQVLALMSAACGLLLVGSVILVNTRVVRPIRLLLTGTEALRSGNFSHRVPVVGEHELGALSRSFNEMATMVGEYIERLTRAVDDLKAEIAERRAIEQQLRQSESMLARAQRIAHIGNWESDLELGSLHWSDEVYRIYGMDPNGERITHAGFWAAVLPEDRAPMRAAADQARRNGVPYALDHRIIRPDGTVRVVREQAERAGEEAGRTSRLVGTVQDITEQTQIEEQLRQSQKMEAIGSLAGGIAHDFNNLLTVITGYESLLLDQLPQSDPARECAEEVLQAAARATGLTQQLLAFSRRQILQPRILDLNHIVANISKMLHRVLGEDVSLVTVLSPSLWPVSADRGQLEQVIMNLAVNARDAMGNGGKLTIETANATLDETYARDHVGVHSGDYVVLTATDTGHGMDAAIQRRIFEPFFTTKEPGKGTGLGLATVYGIVKQSGGHVTVYSEPGHGTVFKVYLPRADALPDPEEPRQTEEPQSRGTGTILLVEDEEGVRKLTQSVLERNGFTVLAARSGPEALDVCARHSQPILLLLTDLVMPEMDGLALARKVVELQPGIRVVYMSGYTEHAVLHRGLFDPDTVFLQKPFTPQALTNKIREALQ